MTGIPGEKLPPAELPPPGGALATLVVRRFLRHSPPEVWTALTDPDQVRQWFLTEAKVDGRIGGTIEMTTGSFRVQATGRVLSWEPPRLYEYEWNVAPRPSLPEGERSIVRWELRPVEGGTQLTLTHSHLTRSTADVFGAGMEAFLDRLEAQLDGRPLPDWEERLRDIRGAKAR
ncbi:MAG: SRPBCC family protein [Thermoplasmata archaeon]|nr:SRPBCC family protein [Thermoplasmata archaeon]